MLLALTGTGLALLVGAAVLFGRQRPAAEAALEARLPAPQTRTRLSAAGPPENGAALQAEFRALLLDPGGATAATGKTDTVIIRLPVSLGDCAALETWLGGGCGKPALPQLQPGNLSVQSGGEPLQGVMQLTGAGIFEMSQSGAASKPQPTEWTLYEQSPEMTLEITCNPGDGLLLAGAAKSETVTCSRFGPEYALKMDVPASDQVRVHLNGIHWINAHLVGDAAETTVDEGQLILDRREEPFDLPEPEKFTIRGAAPHSVHLEVGYARSGEPHTSVTTELASTAEGAGHQLPTWVERHSEFSYLVIGAVVGIFLTACFEFAAKVFLARRRK